MSQIDWNQQITFLLSFFGVAALMLFLAIKFIKKNNNKNNDEFRLPKTGECIEILEDYREENFRDGKVTLMLFAGQIFTVKNYVGIGDCIETSFGVVSLTALRFCNYKVWEEC